jgi:hypothetical protein
MLTIKAEMGVFYNIRRLLQIALSSMETIDNEIISLEPKEVAMILLKVWEHIFIDTQNKPFTKELGKRLHQYIEVT